MTPIKAIRAKCLDCCCGNTNEVTLCPCTDCPLYIFREGHNPNIKPKEYTGEERAKLAEKMARIRAKKNGGM